MNALIEPETLPDADTLLAQAFDGQAEHAARALRAQLVDAPHSVTHWSHFGIACGLAGRFAEGVAALRRALELAPGHVLSQAYLGALLHLDGCHADALEVLDHEGMINEAPLLPSGDEAELAEFNVELLAHVRSHRTLTWELPGKATRRGWQTDELLNDDAPVVARLHTLLQRQLRTLLDDETTPLKLTAWGVALRSGGFQQPHVHQAGILSGVYYVQVPAMTGPRDAGCLRFPRTLPWLPRAASANPHENHLVRPCAGQVVVFPSYFWHDTVPFEADGERVSIAFDLLAA